MFLYIIIFIVLPIIDISTLFTFVMNQKAVPVRIIQILMKQILMKQTLMKQTLMKQTQLLKVLLHRH